METNYPCIETSGPAWETARRVRIAIAAGKYAPGDYEHGEAQRLISEGKVPAAVTLQESHND